MITGNEDVERKVAENIDIALTKSGKKGSLLYSSPPFSWVVSICIFIIALVAMLVALDVYTDLPIFFSD